ncbi:hypothetical protein C0J52_08754 [Blattella germanica]|nr:hypothetical protein C0J52_08754 [Blattella germanica]
MKCQFMEFSVKVGLSVNRPPPGFAAVPVGSAEMPKIAPPTSVPSISVLTSSVQSMAITTPTVSMTSVMSQAPTLNVTTDASSQNQLFMQPQPCSMPPTANAPSIVNPLYNPLVANAGQYLPQSQFVNMQQPSQQQIALDLWKQQVMQSMMMNPFTAIMCNPQIAAAATNNQYALAAAAAAAATSNPYAMAAAAAATSNPFATAVATNNPFATAVATAAMMGNSINNPFGMSMVNPTMLYPQQVPNKTTNLGPLEVNISEVLSPVQGIEPSSLLFQSSSQNSNNSTTSEPVISTPPSPPTVPNSSGSSPITHLYQRVEVDANTLMIDNMNAACSTEPHTNIPIDSSKKAAESTSSSASNVLEQFDIVSVTKLDTRIENSEPEQESEPLTTIEDFECPAEIYRSDDEETDDAIVEKEIEEIIMNVKKLQHVKKVQLAKKTTHIVNIKSVPHLCTDELVRIFTEFSGRHVIVKILDAKNVSLPFRDISRSEEPEVFKALDLEEVVGVPKVDGIIVGRLNVTPLQALPQLMTMLSMQNREIFRAAHISKRKSSYQDKQIATKRILIKRSRSFL